MSICIRSLLGLCLASIASLTTFADIEPNNTFNTAQAITLGQPLSGTLDTAVPSDIDDYYTFAIEKNGLFRADITPDTTLDVEIELIDDNQDTTLISKSSAGIGGAESIEFVNLRPGTYFLRVGTRNGKGTYNLVANFSPATMEDVEPNDEIETSIALALNKQMRGNLGFHGNQFTDRVDYYSLELDNSGELNIFVGPAPTLDVGITLLAYDGTTVISDVNATGAGQQESISVLNLMAGQYYIRVNHKSGYGTYTLSYPFISIQENENDVEPNDRISVPADLPFKEAGSTALLAAASGQLGYLNGLYQDNMDYYSVFVPSHAQLTFNLTPVAEKGKDLTTGYEFFDQNGKIRASSDQFDLVTETMDPGIYTLRVYRKGGHGVYTLAGAITERNPDSTPIPSTAITVNSGSISIPLGLVGATHTARIEIPEDGHLLVRENFQSNVHVATELFWPNGKRITGVEPYYSSSEHRMEIKNVRKGGYVIYQVTVKGYPNNESPGSGAVSAELTPSTAVDPDDNDDFTSQPVKLLGETHSGNLGYLNNAFNDVRDYYVFDTEKDGELKIAIKGESTLHFRVELYSYENDNLQYINASEPYYTTNTHEIVKKNTLAGRYVVAFFLRGNYGSYEWQADLIPNLDEDPEPNNRITQAKPVEFNRGYVGHIGYDKAHAVDTEDWYRIVLPYDGSLKLTSTYDNTLHCFTAIYHGNGLTEVANKESYYTLSLQEIGSPNLQAGTYYIAFKRKGNYGSYRFFLEMEDRRFSEESENDNLFDALPMELKQYAPGLLGHFSNTDFNNHTYDHSDWYSVEISEAGRYQITTQTDPSLHFLLEMFSENGVSRVFNTENYYTPSLQVKEVDLSPGLHYFRAGLRGNYGRYLFSIAKPGDIATGEVQGTILDQDGYPVFNATVSLQGRSTKTDAEGKFAFDKLMPGGEHDAEQVITFPLSVDPGAQYYKTSLPVEIRVARTTDVNVTVYDVFTYPPADPVHYYGNVNDGFITLFWSPSSSPNVGNGGGYRLYVNDEEAIDLKGALTHTLRGLVNGQPYTLRLAVYDRLGQESEGKTLTLTPTGEIVAQPTATPTQTPVNPTATPRPAQPTATSTPAQAGATPTPLQATNTPAPVENTPTPTEVIVLPTATPTAQEATATPTATPVSRTADFSFEFDQGSLLQDQWFHLPGGFIPGTPGGTVSDNASLSPSIFGNSKDGRGYVVTVQEHEVSFLMCINGIKTDGRPAIIRARVRSNGSGGQIALGALKGTILTGENLDGSIGLGLFTSTANFVDQAQDIYALAKPDNGDTINPFIQIAGNRPGETIVWIDKVEVILLDPNLLPE